MIDISSAIAKALRGELVPQSPDDEPASALLERIRGGRDEVAMLAKALQSRKKAEIQEQDQ